MALPNELHPLQLGAGSVSSYQIEQSLRFDGSGTYLQRTPSSSGNRQTFTISFWIKRGQLGSHQQHILIGNAGNGLLVAFTSTDELYFYDFNIVSGGFQIWSQKKFRDPSAWYHIVFAADTTQATASNRVKVWINGVQEDLSTYNLGAGAQRYPGQNGTFDWNHTNSHEIGDTNTNSFEGYLAEIHNVDGSQLDHEDFGEYDVSGVWRPIAYSGSYGTNGFYLKCDPSATNGLGHDDSGNGNNFTPSGFATTGTGTDVMSDTPTTNFNTFNSAIRPYTATPAEVLSDGNLKLTCSSSGVSGSAWTTMLITSGKWYWEATLATAGASNNTIGWCNSTEDAGRGTNVADLRTNGVCYVNDGDKVINVTKTSYGDSFTTGDAIGAALDADTGTVTFYKNGVSQGDITGQSPQSDSAGWLAAVEGFNGTVWEANFGQREFLYPPGTASATSYFNTVLYTGNNSTNAITGVGFAPDLVWIKPRSTADHHRLNDTLRGVNKTISSNLQNPEYGPVNAYLDSFDSDGFTVSTSDLGWNNSSHTYVAWCWNAGGTTAGNTDGTITSSIRANQDAGFSIVTWSGSNADATVGHGLGTTPGLIFFKRYNNTTSWAVYHSSLGANNIVYLNETAASSSSGTSFGSTPTAPTSTVFSVGDNGGTNYGTMIAYCWAEKPGVTKIGSYEGNGLASGLSVDVGFKPAMVIIKNADAVDDWNIIDNRTPPNANLRPNSTSAEDSAVTCYLTPTGFTVATGNSHRINFANETFIYIAFAENFSADATYKALNTANLPAPEIEDGSKHFSVNTWTGNGTTDNALTGFGHQPDFVWGKARNQAYAHALFDSIRGGGYRVYNLGSTPPAQDYLAEYIKSFDSDGITLGSDGNLNGNNVTYVGWSWKGGGTVSANNNTDGTITTTVSANPTGGFSVIKYTSNNSAGATIGHGLGVAPAFFIIKNIDATDHYAVYHQSLGNTKALLLNSSNVPYTGSVWWNNTSPSSTVITLGTETSNNNSDSDDYICWAWAEVEGYSKFGSYLSNGSTDGPFVYCGFSPAMIIIKQIDYAANFVLLDKERYTYNPRTQVLYPNASSPEVSLSGTADVDFLSNGFKLRTTWDNVNSSQAGITYAYMAWAENPFGGDGVSPAAAR